MSLNKTEYRVLHCCHVIVFVFPRFWLDGVLPMVMDREVGAQERCMSLLEEVILDNITTLNR